MKTKQKFQESDDCTRRRGENVAALTDPRSNCQLAMLGGIRVPCLRQLDQGSGAVARPNLLFVFFRHIPCSFQNEYVRAIGFSPLIEVPDHFGFLTFLF